MPMTSIDRYDRKPLEALQTDSRLTNLELADRAGLSASPCLRRVRSLETTGIIKSYGAKLDLKKIGLGMTVFVAVNIERHGDADALEFREAVLAFPEVISCYITSGEYDFLLHVVTPDLDGYRQFSLEKLIRLQAVKSINSSFVIDTIKDAAPFPLAHLST